MATNWAPIAQQNPFVASALTTIKRANFATDVEYDNAVAAEAQRLAQAQQAETSPTNGIFAPSSGIGTRAATAGVKVVYRDAVAPRTLGGFFGAAGISSAGYLDDGSPKGKLLG